MITTTRSKAVIRNARTGFIKTIVAYILQFVVRTIIMYTLGAEYVGLNGLFSNILGCLSLAELGFGTAIVVSLYKPVAENDEETIKSLIKLYSKVYAIISIVILVIGLAVMPTIKFLIKAGTPENINIYIIYLLLLINTVISYFAANRRSLLFVYQRNDIENNVKTICTTIMYALQIAFLLLFKNYYVYMSIMPITTMVESLIIVAIANKKFTFIKGKAQALSKDAKKEVISNIKALSWHQIGGVLVLCTDNIIISAMLGGLKELGIYSNYTMITTCVLAVITILINSFQASVGNLLASESTENTYTKFKQINLMFSFIVGFCSICIFVLAQDFVLFWLKKSECLLSYPVLLAICFSFYFSNCVITPNMYNVALGLVKYNIWKPFCQGIINLVVSIVLAKFMGLIGVIIGTIASYVLMPVWVEPFTLFKYYFKRSAKEYVLQSLSTLGFMLISGAITFFVCSFLPHGGLWLLIVRFVVCALVCLTTLLLLYAILPEFKQCVAWGKSILGNIKLRHQTAVVNNESVIPVEFVAEDPESMENSVLMSDIILAETLVENEKNAANKIDNKDDSVEKIDNGKIISQDNKEESAVKPNGIETNMSNCSDGKTKDRNTDNFDKD